MVASPCTLRFLPVYGLELESSIPSTCRAGKIPRINKCLSQFEGKRNDFSHKNRKAAEWRTV